jgi:hypothetical protein
MRRRAPPCATVRHRAPPCATVRRRAPPCAAGDNDIDHVVPLFFAATIVVPKGGLVVSRLVSSILKVTRTERSLSLSSRHRVFSPFPNGPCRRWPSGVSLDSESSLGSVRDAILVRHDLLAG